MCGRFTLTVSSADLARLYTAEPEDEDWSPSYSVAPSRRIPAVQERLDDDGALHRRIVPMTWGLRPSWAGDKAPKPINARLETAAEKPMFRQGFRANRIVVPMTGYYEWVPEDGGKQPYYLHAEGRVLSAAGLAAHRQDETGEWTASCTILTHPARDAAGDVHDRMPVLLDDELTADWLAPGQIDTEAMTQRLGRIGDEQARSLQLRRVSRRVNSTRTANPSDAGLIEPEETLPGV